MMTAASAQGPVEARSLSSITTVASNPPAYPRNPTQKKLDPLVLYIVRVPGSKDIFLSPLKPPTKSSVSAEAVNASLYYLHVATPEDDALLREVKREGEEAQMSETLEAGGADDLTHGEITRLNNVRRKPLAEGADTGHDARAGLLQQEENDAPPPPPPPPPHSPAVPRRPVPMPQASAENMSFSGTPAANVQRPAESEQPSRASADLVNKNTVPGRPLPPLPNREEPWLNSPADDDHPKKINRWSAFAGHLQGRGLEKWKETYEALSAGRRSLDSSRPPFLPRPSQDRTGPVTRSPAHSPTRQRGTSHSSQSNAGFHITLIRRDPTSGTQWNVATISTPRMDRNVVDIEISTLGYNRFIASKEPLSLASLTGNLPAGLGRAGHWPAEQPSDQPVGPRKFHRQLCVSKPFDDSAAAGGRSPTDYGNGSHPEGPPPSSKLKSGYYVFTSPWNGICTFASSVNGRSLKCKHMIPGPGGTTPASGDPDATPAVTVAELRFNTPFQAANLHSHAHHATRKPNSHHTSPFTLSQNPPLSTDAASPFDDSRAATTTSPATSKRNSLSQFLNPNSHPRPPVHAATAPSSTRINPPPTPVRESSSHAPRFSRHGRSTSASSGGGGDGDGDAGADSDSEDRLDLSLAHEPAGGGMRGKSAKLGKLVVEDEGIKMLDLVVAACMAVWWRGYYY